MLLSFMGSIGYIMSGSELKGALCEIYAEKSTDKILDGHAFRWCARAVSTPPYSSSSSTDYYI